MATQVKIPGIGPVDKKYVYAGIAVTAGIVGYAWWNAKRSANAEPTTSDYTGEAVDGGEYFAGTDYAYDGGVSEYTGATGSQNPVYVDSNPLPTTNAEWATMAVDKLTDIGFDALTASAAIGKYLARLELTEAQADIVRQATALLGNPPNGEYQIKVTVTPPTTTPPDNSTNVPPGNMLPAPTGLTTWGNGPSRLTVPLKWNPVPGADYYRVYRKGVAYNIGSSEDTQITIGGLQPNTSYTFHVRAVGHDGGLGKASATKTVKTKK